MFHKKMSVVFFIILTAFIVIPSIAFSAGDTVEAVNITATEIDVATDCGNSTSNCTWEALFKSSSGATINLLDSKIMSTGEDYKANSVPAGDYKYMKFSLSKFEIVSGEKTFDILSKLVYEKHINKSNGSYYLYASSNPSFQGEQSGEDVMFMLPFSVEKDGAITMTVNFFLPEEAVKCQNGDCMLTQPPVISIGHGGDEGSAGGSGLGILKGNISNLPSADKPVYIGFFPAGNIPQQGQPPVLGAEAVVSGTTGTFTSALPDGSYYIVGFQDADPDDTGGMPMPNEGVDSFYNDFKTGYDVESGITTTAEIDFGSDNVEIFDGSESVTLRIDLSNISSQNKTNKKLYLGLFPNDNGIPCNQAMQSDDGPEIGEVKRLEGSEDYKDITIEGIEAGEYCVFSLLDIVEEDYTEPTNGSDYLGCYGDCMQNNSTGLTITAGQDNVFTSTSVTLSVFDMGNFAP